MFSKTLPLDVRRPYNLLISDLCDHEGQGNLKNTTVNINLYRDLYSLK